MTLPRAIAVAVAAALLLGTLGGCAFSGASIQAMALRLNEDGSYSLALCEDMNASQISLTSTEAESPGVVLWSAAGKVSLSSGTVVTTGSVPSGMVEAVPFKPEPDSGRRLVVEFNGIDRYRNALDEWQAFDQSELRVGVWSWSASTDDTDGPCELLDDR